jgi:hypothetical protein
MTLPARKSFFLVLCFFAGCRLAVVSADQHASALHTSVLESTTTQLCFYRPLQKTMEQKMLVIQTAQDAARFAVRASAPLSATRKKSPNT